jgi:hypothetical protein
VPRELGIVIADFRGHRHWVVFFLQINAKCKQVENAEGLSATLPPRKKGLRFLAMLRRLLLTEV